MPLRYLVPIILLIAGVGGYLYYSGSYFKAPVSSVATSTPESSSGGAAIVHQDADELCVSEGGTWNAEVNECVLPLVVVASPKDGDLVTSPLTVSGKARGYWYFEASFPLEITDSSGKVLAQSHAQAMGEWMTEDYVPFEGKVNFKVPTGGDGKGFMVFKKDNPSGLPENDDSVRVPIRFY